MDSNQDNKPTSAVDKYASQSGNPLDRYGGSSDGLEPETENRCYATRTANLSVTMLDVRFKTGNSAGLSYSYLVDVTFNPSEGITATFTGHTLTIKGRNLKKIYAALLDYRLSWVMEADWRDEYDKEPKDDEPFIEILEVTISE